MAETDDHVSSAVSISRLGLIRVLEGLGVG
jgi:hypothetical protein